MKRSYLSLLLAATCLTGTVKAQNCYTDEIHRKMIQANPELAKAQHDFDAQVEAALKRIDYSKLARTTAMADMTDSVNFWYDIPIVIHVVHDYGSEFLTDDQLYSDVKDWNTVYAKQNADTSDVIAPFKKWIGNPHIRLHLATKDPNGNPTKGITRQRSFLTYFGQEQAKFMDWAPTSYVNIWFVNTMSAANGMAAAYAHFPSDVTYTPYYDGIIALSSYHNVDKTINHEMGHCFSLYHPWGSTNNPDVACGDDAVDDTPPTKGHNTTGCTNANLYDTTCATNYFKLYTDISGHDSLVNYPDTTNAQNIMDYTYCSKMFTKGQVTRMHLTLNNNTAGRNNLWDTTNLRLTGVTDGNHNILSLPDLKPVPEYSASKTGSNYMDRVNYFIFPNTTALFKNYSWRDTVTNMLWTFTDGSGTVTTSTVVATTTQTFHNPGWVKLDMKVTGNHSGDTTVSFPQAAFVADATGHTTSSNMQDFNASGDRDKWPFFNYYNNEFKWQYANVGYGDNFSLEYVGYDSRITGISAYPTTGTPHGDFDDFFTVPMDLSGYSNGHCSINFDISGASRSSNSNDITDTLAIDYTINGGTSWTKVTILSKGLLDNKGALGVAYSPLANSDWAHRSFDIPQAALTNYTTFRFRYKPGVGQAYPDGTAYSSGNNFFLDNIGIRPWPAAVGNVNMTNTNIAVVPNPTSGAAYVVIKDADNTEAKIVVTDITGKVVYTTTQQVTGNQAQIEIPQSAISVKGMYIVQVATGANTNTQKLVVY